jgi:hypothetical protein
VLCSGSEGAYACMHVPSTASRAHYKCMETELPRGVFFFFLMADGCDSRAISISIGPARCLFALLAS